MTSTLQEQLQRLAVAAGISTKRAPRGKPSLLYTFDAAGDVGVEEIHKLALQGQSTNFLVFCNVFLIFLASYSHTCHEHKFAIPQVLTNYAA